MGANPDQRYVLRPFVGKAEWPRDAAVPTEHRPLGVALVADVAQDGVCAVVGDVVIDQRGRWCLVHAW